MKAIIVPIDNRPITYLYPQILGQIAGIEMITPPREIMGSLTADTSTAVLNDWLNHSIQRYVPDIVFTCLDSIVYGGLIPSRRIETSAAEVLERAKVIGRWKRLCARVPRVYAQSSIMRISDNYDNSEEKSYWSRYGRDIFAWSEALHRLSNAQNDETAVRLATAELRQVESRIDENVRRDYLDTRWRNFQLNRRLIDFAQTGEINFLIFSQDDSGQHGLNVMEKERLLAEASRRQLNNVIAYSGADEVLMTLIARWLIEQNGRPPAVKLVFSPDSGANIASCYEGQTIGESVKAQMAALSLEWLSGEDNGGGDASAGTGANAPASLESSADLPVELQIIIHTSGDRQGDHIWLPGHPDLRQLNTSAAVAQTISLLEAAPTACILCDVAYANGADPLLWEQLLQRRDLLAKLWGYAGWNTSGNSIGCALATGIARWFAEKSGYGQQAQEPLQKALFVRLADDWAYQTQVRSKLDNNLSGDNLQALMAHPLERIGNALNIAPERINLSLPWHRSFEIEVCVDGVLQPR